MGTPPLRPERGELSVRPAWWREFLQKVKMFFYGFKGFSNYRFTDKEIETLLLRGYRKTRNARGAKGEGGEMRFSIDGETKIFSLSELLQRFKDELSGTELNAEQQGIYDVVTGESKKTVIRKEDLETLEEFVLLKGGRGKGAKKIIQVHYAGVRGPVTALEIVNIGDVIRRGTYIPGDEAHPTSRTYELTTDDGARLRVVVDYDKQKNKSVINFYSNRKNGNRAHEASSGSITDSRITIAPESGKVKHSPEGVVRFSIIGEEGAGRGREAEARMSGLRIAREMEAAGKDAKTIKRATGWERGGDGKWRIEIPDLKIKREETLPDGTTYAKSELSLKFYDGALGEYVDAPELFEAYPELRNIRLAVRPAEMSDTGFSYGYFDKSGNMIVVYSDVSHAEEVLVHEVQHAIQALEGFPGGGDGREMGAEYWKLAGEVEAYNAAKRRKMTAEEKRESLLEETADVAEEDKIYLTGADGLEHSFAEDNFYYQKALDAYFRGEWHVEKSLPLAVRTPDIYLRLKLKDKGVTVKNIPWSLAYSAVRKGLGQQVSTSNGEAHCLRPEDFKKLPDAIYHPVMILDSNTDKSLEIITDLFDQNGKPVLLALRLDVEEEHHKVNSIRSVYGKDNVNTLINKLRDGRGRYVDMKRAANWSQSIGVQFPEEVLLKSRSPYIIIENGEKSSVGATKSEKNLRFSIEQYSDADWSDMVTYMKAKVGDLLTKSDAEYRKMLESAGMECYSEADAHACAVEAMNANLEDAKARRKEEMMNWIVENNTWIQRIAEVTGSPEFKIRPSYRFQGMDFTGAYISQAWRDCSGNPKAKNREKRLRESEAEVETAESVCDPVPFLDIVIEPAVDFDLFFFCGLLLEFLTELLFVFAFFDGVGGERFRAGIEAFVFFDDLFDFVEFGFFATFFAVCGEETFALEVGVVRDDHIGGDFLSGFFGEEFCGFFGGDGGGGAGFFGFAVIDPGSGEGFVRAVVFGTGVDLEVFAVFPHKKFGPFIGVIDCVAFAFVTGFECAFALHFDGECGGVAEEFFIVYGVEMPSAFCEDGGCFFWFDEV